jgi:adenosine kinase
MKKHIIVSGSLAYDRIMDFSGYFHEHILPEKIHVLNVCFQVDGVKEKFGGTAGNIAYALTLMGQKPLISAAVGRDYHRYFDWLDKKAISRELVRVIDDELTACAYITTDRADNQITGWNPGAMKYTSALDFDRLDPGATILIVSPGNLDDMINYPRLCKSRGIDYIFDPGQSLPMLDPADLTNAIDGSAILISNDYELDLIIKKTDLTKKDLLKRTRAIITTLGELGSRIVTTQGEIAIPTAMAREVLDPTGAGDSYRGGLITGLVEGREITDCARLGSVCASFAVECYGTQEYTFRQKEFEERLRICSDACGALK